MNKSQKEAIKKELKQSIKDNEPQEYLATDFVDKFFSCGETFSKIRADIQDASIKCFATIMSRLLPFIFNPNGRC